MDEAKEKILQTGGTHEITFGSGESFLDWLTFLTNPLNLKPGLPELTLTLESHIMDDSEIIFSFDKQRASLLSLKMNLDNYMGELKSLFEDTDDETKEIIMLMENQTSRPRYLRKWIFNLSLNKSLEELQVPFINSELRDLLALIEKRKRSN